MEEKKLYTSPEAAQALGVSASHMRNMIRTGIAQPKCAIGGTWMFTQEEIERLRNRKRTRGPSKKQ
jgi:predicted site-specific integrase-resolvase